MNLLETIHSRWAANATLNGLLPAATKLQTGVYQYAGATPPFPFATVNQIQRVPRVRTAGIAIDAVAVTFAVFHGRSNYDEAVAITQAIHGAFDRSHFNLSANNRVIDAERGNEQPVQDEYDDWGILIDYEFRVYLAAGA